MYAASSIVSNVVTQSGVDQSGPGRNRPGLFQSSTNILWTRTGSVRIHSGPEPPRSGPVHTVILTVAVTAGFPQSLLVIVR